MEKSKHPVLRSALLLDEKIKFQGSIWIVEQVSEGRITIKNKETKEVLKDISPSIDCLIKRNGVVYQLGIIEDESLKGEITYASKYD